jgi:hypothetical protein
MVSLKSAPRNLLAKILYLVHLALTNSFYLRLEFNDWLMSEGIKKSILLFFFLRQKLILLENEVVTLIKLRVEREMNLLTQIVSKKKTRRC